MPRTAQPTGRTAYVPNDTFVVDIDGIPTTFQVDVTRVSEDWLSQHPELRGLFRQAPFHFDVVEAATAVPGETR